MRNERIGNDCEYNLTIFDFMMYVKDTGVLSAPIFAILYWLERDERKDLQKELKDVSQTTLIALNELKMMVGQLASIFDNRSLRK